MSCVDTMIRRWCLPLVCVIGMVSCTTDYGRDFKKAVVPPNGAAGPWKGRWHSAPSGHEGPLWCMVDGGDGDRYTFRYRAGWGVMRFGDYTHRPEVRRSADGTLRFSGSMELPGNFGVYEVDGTVTSDRFHAEYRSDRGDRGTMEMSRP